MSYTQDIPNAPNNPSQDQPLMKANTNAIFSYVAVDHVPFNQSVSGYHTVIHQTTQANDPVTISGVNQVYAKNITPASTITVTDTQLFTRTGQGVISQLTGWIEALDNDSLSQGYAWIGGILVQWGTSLIINNVITFKDRIPGAIKFPNNIFQVNLSLNAPGSTSAQATISARSITKSGFTMNPAGSIGSYTSFSWIAIGN